MTDDARTILQKALAARGVPIDRAGEILAGTNPEAFVDDGVLDQAALDRFADLAAGGSSSRPRDFGGGRQMPDAVPPRRDGQAEAAKRFGLPEPTPPPVRGGFGALGQAEAAKRFGTKDTGGRGDRSGAAAAGPTLGPTARQLDDLRDRGPALEAHLAKLRRSLRSDTIARQFRRRR